MIPIKECYEKRFLKIGLAKRNKIWKVLCRDFFQKYVKDNDTVLDLGAGYCEFINNIYCNKKYAVELNPDVRKYANKNVEVIKKNAINLPGRLNNSIDVIFVSNFFEHLNSKDEIVHVVKNISKALKKNGRMIVLQPNISLVKEKYWDFFDHKIPLNSESLKELVEISNFRQELFIEKFFPYSVNHAKFPITSFGIKLYLKLPLFFRPFAGQSIMVARKK